MDALLTNISSVFTSTMGWAGTVATKVVETPILLLGVVVSFVGLGVGLFKRLLHV